LALNLTKKLRFVEGSPDSGRALAFSNGRDLDRQALRGVRQLTPDSAALFDEIIAMTDEVPRSDGLTIISAEELGRYRNGREGTVRYAEGSPNQTLVNRYERDPVARERCILHHGCLCSVCGLDFRAAYGEVAAGFIHVHHLRPLSSIGADYVVNPVKDLRPVCPNCHAIIHRCTPPYSIDKVRSFLKSPRSGKR
jgi:hypothetical protein